MQTLYQIPLEACNGNFFRGVYVKILLYKKISKRLFILGKVAQVWGAFRYFLCDLQDSILYDLLMTHELGGKQ